MKQNFFWSRVFAALMLFAVCVDQTYAEDITFGCYTSDKPTTMYRKFNPIMGYLQKQLASEGIKADIKIKIYPSYMKAIDALVKGDCDFVRFGPASYILAKERNKNIRLLAMEHKNGEKTFKGIFITAKDSPVTSIKELKNRTFAFGNENSTVGRYLSQAELTKAEIRAGDLKSYKYLGRHDKVALAVAAGNYDAGVVKENTYKKYAESRGLRKIGEFPNVTKPWVVRENFDDKFFDALKKALLKLEDKSILKSLKQHGFLSATDDDYAFVREGMRLSTEFRNKKD